MSAVINRFWRRPQDMPEADNDPVTIGHPDANALFADLQRTKADVFATEHTATEANEAHERARRNHQRAWEAMQQHFVDHDLIDPQMPKQEGHGDE